MPNRSDENGQMNPSRGSSLRKSDRGGWRRLLKRAGDRKDIPKWLILGSAVILAAAFALAVILVCLALAFSFYLPAQA